MELSRRTFVLGTVAVATVQDSEAASSVNYPVRLLVGDTDTPYYVRAKLGFTPLGCLTVMGKQRILLFDPDTDLNTKYAPAQLQVIRIDGTTNTPKNADIPLSWHYYVSPSQEVVMRDDKPRLQAISKDNGVRGAHYPRGVSYAAVNRLKLRKLKPYTSPEVRAYAANNPRFARQLRALLKKSKARVPTMWFAYGESVWYDEPYAG
jgi:hypothetical protein